MKIKLNIEINNEILQNKTRENIELYVKDQMLQNILNKIAYSELLKIEKYILVDGVSYTAEIHILSTEDINKIKNILI